MNLFQSESCEVVPKNQISIMLVRGVAGIGLLAWSVTLLSSLPWVAFPLLGLSLWLLKGCPACWALHMANTVRDSTKIRRALPSMPSIEQATSRRKRKYQPRDMSVHLFPPEDVLRFRQMSKENANSSATMQEQFHDR